jgi:hypothetical protein
MSLIMETKICNRCKKEYPVDCFYFKDKEHKCRRWRCKYCEVKDKVEYAKNLTWEEKIKRLESKARSYEKHKDEYNKKKNKRRHEHLEEMRIKKAEYRERNKWKGIWQARNSTQYIISKFNIRPSVCPICWQQWKIQAHHIDYSEPTKIYFVCFNCHMKIHSWALQIDDDKIINLNNIHKIREHKPYSNATR